MKAWLRSTLFYCLGVLISTLCAIVLAKLYNGTEWKIEGPLLFAITLVILASHFGAMISVAGALLGAAMFAFFLYNPENSFRVSSETDRSTLAWMILISVSLSYLLYPTRSVRAVASIRALHDDEVGKRCGLRPEDAVANNGEIPPKHANSRRSDDPASPQHANSGRAGSPALPQHANSERAGGPAALANEGASGAGCELSNGGAGREGRG